MGSALVQHDCVIRYNWRKSEEKRKLVSTPHIALLMYAYPLLCPSAAHPCCSSCARRRSSSGARTEASSCERRILSSCAKRSISLLLLYSWFCELTGGSHARPPRLRIVQPQLSTRTSACFMSRGVIWQAGAVEEDPLRAQERELLAKAESLPLAQEESSLLARGVSFRYSSFIVTFASWRGGVRPPAHPGLFKISAISN